MTSSNAASAAESVFEVATRDPDALVVLVGPTASGKTALAVELAERLCGEVVSADSVQIYRDFDVGSGKPSAEELARVPHHLVGALDPLEPVDASRFASMASACIDAIRARGKRPIVCGGTYLWVRALVHGLAEAPPASESIRAEHRAIALAEGRPALHARLREVDAASADRLHPNDMVRVSRALEVFALTGKRMSELQEGHGFRTTQTRANVFAIAWPWDTLSARIEARVQSFLAAGWVDETRSLLARGYGDARAMGAVGYKQVRAHLEGELDGAELETAIVRATRVFARRQRTWLRSADVRWIAADGMPAAAPL
jgi:tRNA dimethylallyltransferase